MKKFLLLWFVGAVLVVIPLSRINLVRFYRLAHEGVSVRGEVIGLEPAHHQAVHYSYDVDGHSYSGIGWADFGNPRFGFLSVGQSVFVYYLPKDPSTSCLGYPNELLNNEEIPIALAALVFPPFALLAWSWRYPSFRQWLSRR